MKEVIVQKSDIGYRISDIRQRASIEWFRLTETYQVESKTPPDKYVIVGG